MDTIFVLSTGAPPAAIAVVRVSGPRAGDAVAALAGRVPEPRRATSMRLRSADGSALDDALVLWLPGPGTATGEDIAEFHLHGGRAVVAAVEGALALLPGLRPAEAGEFTRRAFANGRIDLAEAEGLADLLSAETELQRRAAIELAGGALSRQVDTWRDRILTLSAAVEAVLDFGDEDDVGAGFPPGFREDVAALSGELDEWLTQPRAEPLKEGIRVVFAGPPNSGKSSLFNAMLGYDAAIIADIPGTTRDVIEQSIAIDGVPFVLVDTAGMRSDAGDPIEREGIARAHAAAAHADIVVWLGESAACPPGGWDIEAKADIGPHKANPRLRVSSKDRRGLRDLAQALVDAARSLLPAPGRVALNARQHALVSDAATCLRGMEIGSDPLIIGERLRQARSAFDKLTGRASTEDMLDALFGRFCIGK